MSVLYQVLHQVYPDPEKAIDAIKEYEELDKDDEDEPIELKIHGAAL